MNRKSSHSRYGLAVLLALVLILAFYVTCTAEVTVTPLLDTPNNRIYYDKLLNSFRNAESSISVMVATADYYPEYPDGLQSRLYDSLIRADKRGVEVRVILDESDWSEEVTKTNRKTAEYLRDRGLEVRFDDPKVTTHAKTVIVDEEVVFLGSSNWNYPTYAETYQTNVKLVSKKVGRFYGRFFDAVWRGEVPRRVNVPELTSGKTIVPLVSTEKSRAYYRAAKKLIRGAEKSVDLVVFKITRYGNFGRSKSNLLTEELVKARERGVEIRVVLDVNTWSEKINQSNRETALWLLGQGVRSVKLDSREITTHSKALIVDGKSVIVGSSNWSYYSLAKNVEIDLVINDVPSVAEAFEVYFEEIWQRADIPSREELSGTP
jgi:phosphatidylserine/phosphatidylglycerophosphate/cardiolipin synthase-like enzyme